MSKQLTFYTAVLSGPGALLGYALYKLAGVPGMLCFGIFATVVATGAAIDFIRWKRTSARGGGGRS